MCTGRHIFVLYLYTRDYNNKESILISQEGIPIKIISCYLY
jgi:hypothetical protein